MIADQRFNVYQSL